MSKNDKGSIVFLNSETEQKHTKEPTKTLREKIANDIQLEIETNIAKVINLDVQEDGEITFEIDKEAVEVCVSQAINRYYNTQITVSGHPTVSVYLHIDGPYQHKKSNH